MKRAAHLVGSIPAATTDEAIGLALERLGPLLRTVPDGETGERSRWIVHIMLALRSHPELELVRDGEWSDYKDATLYRVRRGHRLRGESLRFGQSESALESHAVFTRLRDQLGLPGLTFQVGIPSDLDMAAFTLGPVSGLRHRRPFTEATLAEITRVHERLGDDAVFQLEMPVELVMLSGVPSPVQPALARYLGSGIARLARRSPQGCRFGLHLCLGDLGHHALGRMRSARPMVHLINAIVRAWPPGRGLEYVHAPFAAGVEPPVTDPNWYAPLAELRLPSSVRFVAGFAHEDQPLEEQRALRTVIEQRVGRLVDIAAACGLGRMTPATAEAVMSRMEELTADEPAPSVTATLVGVPTPASDLARR